MNEIGAKLGIDESSLWKWYEVPRDTLYRFGAGGLLEKYNSSLYNVLVSAYPEYDFLPWRFAQAPKGSLNRPEVVRKAIKLCEEQLQVRSKEEWNRVSIENLKEMGLGVEKVFLRNGGLRKTLTLFSASSHQ